MAEGVLDGQLLFFDTFSHDTNDELNLDLVQFPKPVTVTEVRVIPLGSRVQADVPGGSRLGATRPSAFQLDFFVNNLNLPNASTFEKLGRIDYQENEDIQFLAKDQVPTDGLIIYGWYSIVTLAVYGLPATVKQERSTPPPVQSVNPGQQANVQNMEAGGDYPPSSFDLAGGWDQQPPSGNFPPIAPLAAQPIQPIQGAPNSTMMSPSGATAIAPLLAATSSNVFSQDGSRELIKDADDWDNRMREIHEFHSRVDSKSRHGWERDADRDSLHSRDRENEGHRTPREGTPDYRSRDDTPPYRGHSDDFHARDGRREFYKDRTPLRSPPRRRSRSRTPEFRRTRTRSRSPRSYSRSPKRIRRTRSRSRTPRSRSPVRRSRSPKRRSHSRSPHSSHTSLPPALHPHSSRPGILAHGEGPYSLQETPASPHLAPEVIQSPPRSPTSVQSTERISSPVRSASKSPVSQSPMSIKEDEMYDDQQQPVTEPGEINESVDDLYQTLGDDAKEAGDKSYVPLSDGEIQVNQLMEDLDADYEQISSDEDNLSDFDEREIRENMIQWDSEMDDTWNMLTASFNPYQCDIQPLETFIDPSLTAFLTKKNEFAASIKKGVTPPKPVEASRIEDLVEMYGEGGKEHHHEWIEDMETLPSLAVPGLVYLSFQSGFDAIIDKLIEFALEGLDQDCAMSQPSKTHKVRHLKMGIMLAGFLSSCDEDILVKLLHRDLQEKLLGLYLSPYVAGSVKLQILRALDCSTRFHQGVLWALGRHPEQKKLNGSFSCYQALIEAMLKKQVSRNMAALSALVKKFNTHEVLHKLSHVIETVESRCHSWVSETLQSAIGCKVGSTSSPNSADENMETLLEPDIAEAVADDELDNIVCCVEEITRIYAAAEHLIAQPRNSLPAGTRFNLTKRPYDPYPNIYHLFNKCRLMESLLVLVSSPATCCQSSIFVSVNNLLMMMLQRQDGLLFLCSRTEVTNALIRSLTQNAEYGREDTGEENPAEQLGLQLIYHLQTMQHIDQLREYHSKDSESKGVDDAEPLGLLHSLYSMMLSHPPHGRDAVVAVLGLDDNIRVLLPFMELTGDNEEFHLEVRKSVCLSYAAMLTLMVVKHGDNVKMLEKHTPRLLAICEQDLAPNKMADKLNEVHDLIQPFTKISSLEIDDALEPMIKQLKQFNDDIADIPKGLITVLRVLHYLSMPPNRYNPDDYPRELKYKYALVELYSADCFTVFINILQKISQHMLQPWQMGMSYNTQQGNVMLSIIQPTVAMVKQTIQQLIQARGSEFKDLTALQTLFTTHTIVCSVPLTGTLSVKAKQIQNDIVDIVMAYTYPFPVTEDPDEGLSKTLWTMALKELLQYVLTAPYTYLGGLVLMSELLPLPLPLQSRMPLNEDEIKAAINQRKLWSAHLHPVQGEFQNIIKALAGSSCQPLQQVLRRVCGQILDLAAPSALMIVKSLLDALLESMDATKDKDKPSADGQIVEVETKDEDGEPRSSGHTSRVLNLLNFVMNQAPIKAAFINITKPGSGESKYKGVIPRLVQLLNVVHEKRAHVQAQEAVVSIFQSLCDIDISLIMGETEMSLEEQLANTLPGSEQMAHICSGLFDHVSYQDHSYSSVLPALRTLTLLMEHDYGFYHIKTALQKNLNVFFNLFQRINDTFSKDSSDCIATLSSAAECLQFLVTVPEPASGEDGGPATALRTYTMSHAEVREILNWKEEMMDHPLDDLMKLLQEYAEEEETLKAVQESVAAVVQIVHSPDEQTRPDVKEPILPAPAALSIQLNMRATYMLTEPDDDRLTTSYWLSLPIADESDHELDIIRCDFEEMAQKYCSDFDVLAELNKGADHMQPANARQRRKIKTTRRGHDTINTTRMRGSNNKFVAPMRGRGFGRGMNQSRSDHFRNRAPNTSRPPSMHVDDFIKMEQQDTQQNLQTGQNMNRRTDKEMDAGNRGGRGFGRGRGFTNRGRFFNRRDGGRGFSRGGRGGQRGGGGSGGGQRTGDMQRGGSGDYTNLGQKVQGSWGSRSGGRQSFSPRGFGRGAGHGDERSDQRRMSQRDFGNGNRFGGRGGGRGGWGGPKKDMDQRYLTPRFQGRQDRGRHMRSFTK